MHMRVLLSTELNWARIVGSCLRPSTGVCTPHIQRGISACPPVDVIGLSHTCVCLPLPVYLACPNVVIICMERKEPNCLQTQMYMLLSLSTSGLRARVCGCRPSRPFT